MQIIDGKMVSEKIKSDLVFEVENLIKDGKQPKLAVVIVGDDFASKKYVASKEKACKKLKIESNTYDLPESTTEEELIKLIDKLNKDSTVDAILVQLPLPKHIDTSKVINRIDANKDVDGFSSFNVGKLLKGEDTIYPCTPYGIIKLLEYYNIETVGKTCTVVGRSNIVGKPVSFMMLNKNATVTIAHSKTENLSDLLRQSDIVIAAIGKTKYITKEMIKEGAVIIDVGINRSEDGTICGDVDFEQCSEKASFITPVPGGVGPMTIAMLMNNCVQLAKIHKGDNKNA